MDEPFDLAVHRSIVIAVLLGGLSAGCSIDVDGIRQGAEELKKQVDSPNLKDCKDENGEPLPEWVCRKTDSSESPKTD